MKISTSELIVNGSIVADGGNITPDGNVSIEVKNAFSSDNLKILGEGKIISNASGSKISFHSSGNVILDGLFEFTSNNLEFVSFERIVVSELTQLTFFETNSAIFRSPTIVLKDGAKIINQTPAASIYLYGNGTNNTLLIQGPAGSADLICPQGRIWIGAEILSNDINPMANAQRGISFVAPKSDLGQVGNSRIRLYAPSSFVTSWLDNIKVGTGVTIDADGWLHFTARNAARSQIALNGDVIATEKFTIVGFFPSDRLDSIITFTMNGAVTSPSVGLAQTVEGDENRFGAGKFFINAGPSQLISANDLTILREMTLGANGGHLGSMDSPVKISVSHLTLGPLKGTRGDYISQQGKPLELVSYSSGLMLRSDNDITMSSESNISPNSSSDFFVLNTLGNLTVASSGFEVGGNISLVATGTNSVVSINSPVRASGSGSLANINIQSGGKVNIGSDLSANGSISIVSGQSPISDSSIEFVPGLTLSSMATLATPSNGYSGNVFVGAYGFTIVGSAIIDVGNATSTVKLIGSEADSITVQNGVTISSGVTALTFGELVTNPPHNSSGCQQGDDDKSDEQEIISISGSAMKKDNRIVLNDGHMVICSRNRALNIVTYFGIIRMKKGALAFVEAKKDYLVVRTISDKLVDSVSLDLRGLTVSVPIGNEVLLGSENRIRNTLESNARRKVSSRKFDNQLIYTSELSPVFLLQELKDNLDLSNKYHDKVVKQAAKSLASFGLVSTNHGPFTLKKSAYWQ